MSNRLVTGIMVIGLVLAAPAFAAVAKSQLRIVVFTDVAERGRELLVRLAARGYSNPASKVEANPNREFNIKYGAAPFAYIEEIATYTEGRCDVDLRRSREFDSTDLDVFINLPFETQAGTNSSRASFRVVVFAEDGEEGEDLLERLAGLGYTNRQNCVDDAGKEEPALLYGSAAPGIVDELLALVLEESGAELPARRRFAADDNDIYIILPGTGELTAPQRDGLRLTVFAPNQKIGSNALGLLAGLGYTNRANEVLTGPAKGYHIKYGACPREFVDEMAAALKAEFGRPFVLLREFGDDPRRVFINIPHP